MSIELALKLIARKVQDSSYTKDDYIDYVNICLGEIASEEAIPFLFKHAVVTVPAGEFSVTLPEDFHSRLLRAHNLETKKELFLFQPSELLERFGTLDENGDVRFAAVNGMDLLVQLVPSSDQEVRIWYQRQPTLIEDDDGEIDFIPASLLNPLIVNYVCAQIYSEIEDGVDGRKINSDSYMGKYLMARGSLRQFLGIPDGTPGYVVRSNFGEQSILSGDLTDEV